MGATRHTFLTRDQVIKRLKAGEKLVHRSARNDDGVVLSGSTFFSDDHFAVTIHPRTYDHLLRRRLIRRSARIDAQDELFEYSGP
jgi:hypothetical protein